MKGRLGILILLVLGGATWLSIRPAATPGPTQQNISVSQPMQQDTSISQLKPAAAPPEIKTNALEYTYDPSSGTGMPLYVDDSGSDTLLSKLPPDALSKYEGSYTLDELLNRDGQPSLNLKSSWFSDSSKLPKASVRVEYDPATGEYNVRGGEISGPKSNVGLSFEKDQNEGETKTFLNWKKEF